MSESFSGRTPRARRESTVKKCTSCAKDLPDAAMHCVFCGAKQPAAAPPPAGAANAKTVMGWQAGDVMKDMQAKGLQPAPGVAMPPPAAPPGNLGVAQTLASPGPANLGVAQTLASPGPRPGPGKGGPKGPRFYLTSTHKHEHDHGHYRL